MELPHVISVYLKSVGLNAAERLDMPNREVYSLYSVDKNNQSMPTGLPPIIEISDGKLITLTVEEALELIEQMNKYKDYLYYKGEDLNPYRLGSKDSYFWNAECRHCEISQNNPQFIKTICNIFKQDYSEVYQRYKDTLVWEIICLFIEEAYETAGAVGDIEAKIKMLKYYGSSRTS